MIEVNDVIITEEDKIPRSAWSLGNVEESIKRDDGQARRAEMKVAKTNELCNIKSRTNSVNILEKNHVIGDLKGKYPQKF